MSNDKEQSRFFDYVLEDGEPDRQYTADEFAEYFRQLITNGIFNAGRNLEPKYKEGTTVTIKPGYAWIEGYMYKLSEELDLVHDVGDDSDRIDRIVLELNTEMDKREVKLKIEKGSPSSEPEPAKLKRLREYYSIDLDGADGGSYKLGNDSDGWTSSIDYDATEGDIKNILEAIYGDYSIKEVRYIDEDKEKLHVIFEDKFEAAMEADFDGLEGAENPELEQISEEEDDTYQILIADVYIEEGTSSISSTDITDQRLNDDYCGLVNSLIKVKTKHMQNEWDNWADQKFRYEDSEIPQERQTWVDEWNDWADAKFRHEDSKYPEQWREWFEEQQSEGFMMLGEEQYSSNLHRALNQPVDERTTLMDYDDDGNLIEVVEKYDEQDIKITNLEYDEDGNLEKVTERVFDSNGTLKAKVEQTLSYDEDGNLEKVERSVS